MNYKVMCIALLVVTGLLSFVIAYLVANISKMARMMNNYTHNKIVGKMTKSLEDKIKALEKDNKYLHSEIERLDEEVSLIREEKLDYEYAYTKAYDSYLAICDVIFPIFKEGLLIKHVSSRRLFESLINDGYVEVYNKTKNLRDSMGEMLSIFGEGIYEREGVLK